MPTVTVSGKLELLSFCAKPGDEKRQIDNKNSKVNFRMAKKK
jgi:hypothetical protein